MSDMLLSEEAAKRGEEHLMTPTFVRRAHDFTLNQLFLGDTILNWVLGVVLTFFPRGVDRVLSTAPPMLPAIVYTAIGIGFFFYAAWQTVILVRQQMGPPALIFAAVLALIPFLGLTAALVFMGLPLKTGFRILLWVGNIYMLLLGIWYLYLASRIGEAGSSPS